MVRWTEHGRPLYTSEERKDAAVWGFLCGIMLGALLVALGMVLT